MALWLIFSECVQAQRISDYHGGETRREGKNPSEVHLQRELFFLYLTCAVRTRLKALWNSVARALWWYVAMTTYCNHLKTVRCCMLAALIRFSLNVTTQCWGILDSDWSEDVHILYQQFKSQVNEQGRVQQMVYINRPKNMSKHVYVYVYVTFMVLYNSQEVSYIFMTEESFVSLTSTEGKKEQLRMKRLQLLQHKWQQELTP